ncbi:hypothetical protein ACQEVB_07575 [Pseudonocardia sp. CA-107938]|uniref:hypothetical protein n=1 Tax=Pseudonocardia sp. CA-107938 TaxID=3240021 RepID=UPI003D91BB2B
MASKWVCPASEEERGRAHTERITGLVMTVDLDIDGVAQQSPTIPAVTLDILASIQETAQTHQVFLLDRDMSQRPVHPWNIGRRHRGRSIRTSGTAHPWSSDSGTRSYCAPGTAGGNPALLRLAF